MRTYTTCGGCGDYVLCLSVNNPTHAGCDPEPTYLERTMREFNEACKADDTDRAAKLEKLIEQIDSTPPRLADAAAIYVNWGWPVFPLKSGRKVPVTRNGFKDATTDEETVRQWWEQSPRANIGIPTGMLFDVLDVDFNHGATKVWPNLRDAPKAVVSHGIALTPGGMHVYLLPNGRGNGAGIYGQQGLDCRGRGGYVVAPPSVLEDGKRYQWNVKPSPFIKTDSPDTTGLVV